jgi:hypothetical protein
MLISRKLFHKVTNRLQEIMTLVETGNSDKAIIRIRELAHLLTAHVESTEEERARGERENS